MNKTSQELVDKIHWGVNPWSGHDVSQWPVNHLGWGSDHHWLLELVASLRPRLIIEVGSFLGGSAIKFGESLEACGLTDSAVLAIDTWLAEELLWSMPEHRDKLNFRNGSPCFYQTFLSNVLDYELEGVVIPLRMPSLSAARYLLARGVPKAQLIYIDGSHIEGDVLRDLEAYWNHLEPGGCLLLDDYAPDEDWYKGLVRDAHRFRDARGLRLERDGRKVRFFKP